MKSKTYFWLGLFAITTLFLGSRAEAAPGYTLTINVVGSGSVTQNPTNAFYPPGANVILSAISNDPTWYFSSWSGDANGTSNPLNVGMDSNKVITATFQQFPTFTLTLATNGQGSISLSPPGGIYASNTPVTVTATPAAGWVFDSWSGSINGNSNPLPITITTNLSLTSTFAQLPAFDVQPQGITNGVGSTVAFSSHAVGNAPLSYQWFFGSSLLSGSTGSTLTLTNAPLADAGNYQVVVTNNYGSVTSQVAVLVLTNASGSTNVLGVCDEPSLRAAISAGGWVSIMCNGTITLTNTINITNHVILDGQNVSLTISGGNAVRLFYVAPGAAFSATNLTLANGSIVNTNPADGGALYNNGGSVMLVGCTLTNNVVDSNAHGLPSTHTYSHGGAIFNTNGTLSLFGCGIYNNTCMGINGFNASQRYWWAYGGAIYNANGLVAISGCSFSRNLCAYDPGNNTSGIAFGGALFQAAGSLLMTNNSFTANQALGGGTLYTSEPPGPGYGGAVVSAGGVILVDHCQFTANAAIGATNYTYPGSGYGGAISSGSSLSVESSTFSGNHASAGNYANGGSSVQNGLGGAIYNTGSAVLNRCSLFSNYVQGSVALVGSSGSYGGNGFGGGIFNASQLSVINCTIALNSTLAGSGSQPGFLPAGNNGNALGGGIFSSTNATTVLLNVTIASNYCIANGPGFTGTNGFAAGVQIANTNGTLRLHNTIIAFGGTNGNAYGIITDDGFNISSDGSANLLGGASYNFTDPKLGPLDYYTGPTLCMALFSNSPAIDFGDSTGAPATDQRWYPRPNGDGVDIGAFEFYSPTQVVRTAQLNMGATINNAGLNFTAFPMNIYRLQCSSDLMTWSDVETNGPFNNVTNINRTFNTQGADRRYFRLLLQ